MRANSISDVGGMQITQVVGDELQAPKMKGFAWGEADALVELVAIASDEPE
jgi:hypothetical protein